MANTFYNRTIRKLVVGFGNIFNDITLVRYNPDNSEAERFIVPIAYAAKEHYVMRLEEDYNLDKKVQMTLPRLSFEMTALQYDSSRKQNSNVRNFNQTSTGVVGQWNPVPYNVDFNLYLYVRNIEDGTQVIEHIIPYFTPDYTIKLNMIPEMGITKEVPIILKNITQDVTYEGDRSSEPRMIIWTLSFTAKANFFGPVSQTNIIKTSITNILNDILPTDTVAFNMGTTGVGSYQVGEVVYQGYTMATSTASARVVEWNNSILKLTDMQGNFVSNQPVYGLTTNANYQFSSYNVTTPASQKYTQIINVANPTDANANTSHTYTSIVQEYPNISNTVITSSTFSGDLDGNIFGVDDLMTQQENPINLLNNSTNPGP